MKKALSVFICIVLALSLYACSSKGNVPPSAQTSAASPDFSSENGIVGAEKESVDNAAGIESGTTLNIGAAENRKIIYEAHMRLEALDFDKAATAILQQLQQLDGYVSSSSVEGEKGVNRRFAEYVLRIPQKNYSAFLKYVSENTNVISQSENAQDITSEYVDIEARLKSLKTQETRLLDMMESAGELETLLAVQNQLADVQYRIESITAQKNTYDKLTQYATVNISLDEVNRITETKKETFGQKLSVAFSESWIDFSEGLQEFIINLVYVMPALIILAIIAVAVLFIVLKASKKRKTANSSLPQNMPPPEIKGDK